MTAHSARPSTAGRGGGRRFEGRRARRVRTLLVAAALGCTFSWCTLSIFESRPAAAQAAKPAQGAGELPPGHPAVAPQDDGESAEPDELPPGHPPTDQGAPADELPPGHPAPSGQGAGRKLTPAELLPQDSSEIDKSLPSGTIELEVRDAKEAPVPNVAITLGIMRNSVAKGESHQQKSAQADASGKVRFTGLETGAEFAYRLTVPWSRDPGGRDAGVIAVYAPPPFQLDLAHGEHAVVHVYPVTSRIDDALVAMQGFAYVELKDDVLQIEEMYRIFNFGATTWVPKDLVFDLPKQFKAFNAQKTMSDIGADPVDGQGARLHGTFGPGQNELIFRYQIPYDGSESFEFSLGMPPRVARMRVIAEATKRMQLEVAGFPQAVSDHNGTGQRVLITERQLRGGDAPLKHVTVSLKDLPGQPAGRWVATLIAALTMAAGIFAAVSTKKTPHLAPGLAAPPEDVDRARALLAREIAELDRARAEGQIGPTAYARLRQTLLDALGRLLSAPAA